MGWFPCCNSRAPLSPPPYVIVTPHNFSNSAYCSLCTDLNGNDYTCTYWKTTTFFPAEKAIWYKCELPSTVACAVNYVLFQFFYGVSGFNDTMTAFLTEYLDFSGNSMLGLVNLGPDGLDAVDIYNFDRSDLSDMSSSYPVGDRKDCTFTSSGPSITYFRARTP